MALTPDVATLLAPLRADPARAGLLLDVDGTLAPIVDHADRATLLPGMAGLLVQARERLGLLGFVTGRSPDDLDRMVALPEQPAGMNHGMQLRRGGTIEIAREAAPHLATVRDFAARWRDDRELARAGVVLEDKGPTLSFHYRTAPDAPRAEDALAAGVAEAAATAGLTAHWGRRVLEVRPPGRVDKGTASRALLDGAPVDAVAYFGDDRTDADAWRELRAMRAEGRLRHVACILARNSEVAAEVAAMADASVDGPPGVREALTALLEPIDAL